MPTPLASLEKLAFLNLLVIAPNRMGKTTLISTAPRPVYVICSDPENKLDSAGADPKLGMSDITFDPVNSTDGAKIYTQFDSAYQEAATGVRDGRYKTVVWDTITSFARLAIQHELAESDKNGKGSDSRRATERYNSEITRAIFRLTRLPCHVVVLSHDDPTGGKIDGQMDKRGFGIVPGIYGSIRAWVAGQFRDVCYLDFADRETRAGRVLRWHMQGCYGLGTNTRPGVECSPANLTEFAAWRMEKGPAAPTAPSGKKVVSIGGAGGKK